MELKPVKDTRFSSVIRLHSDRKNMDGNMFSPYSNNGGTIAAIAGEDYVVIASDTRLKSGYSILSRDQTKLCSIETNIVLATSGCWPDVLTLRNQVAIKCKSYESEFGKKMTVEALAQMLSIMMYYKRFFPYYVNTILAGLTDEGRGVVYSYDPVGHYESSMYHACGEAGSLIQPLLDNQLGFANQTIGVDREYSLEKSLSIVKDVFISAAEREMSVGDEIDIIVLTKDGSNEHKFQLRKD